MTPCRVLIIDDSPEDRATYRRLLDRDRAVEYVFHEAESGEDGLAAFRRFNPDCVLLDLKLPDADGLDVLPQLVGSKAPPACAVIMLTGQGDELVVVEAMKRGVQDYLVKGRLDGDTLPRAVHAAVEKVALLREIEAQRRELERLATTDELTGLLNRRQFMRRLDEEVSRSRRYKTPLSLLLLDIDHFKSINDRFGHPVGDRVLSAVGRVLRDQRETDLVGRLGGEEFGILLTNTDVHGAEVLAQRLRERVALHASRELGRERAAVTCSIGVAELGLPTFDGGDLISAADQALYRAKHTGRDRVCLAAG